MAQGGVDERAGPGASQQPAALAACPARAGVGVGFVPFGRAGRAAALRPRWFRGYYRFSAKLGFGLSQAVGRALLALLFFIVVTPLGLVLRMLGQDPLRLRRPASEESYWSEVRRKSSLDRLF